MSQRKPASVSTETIQKLERRVIATALKRYGEWVKKHGEPAPWGHPRCVEPRKAYEHLMAVKALHEASRK